MNKNLTVAEEHEARTSALERFAERKTAGGFGGLSADQTALYCDIIAAMAYTRELEAESEALKEALRSLCSEADAQAEGEGLRFIATNAAEAYLQQELRMLHSEIKSLARALVGSVPQTETYKCPACGATACDCEGKHVLEGDRARWENARGSVPPQRLCTGSPASR